MSFNDFLGKVNDVIDVAAGFANHLLRNNQAIQATPDNLKLLENTCIL